MYVPETEVDYSVILHLITITFLGFEIKGDLYDHEGLVKAIKQVDVVISAVGSYQAADQVKMIDAIKEAGNVKASISSKYTSA